MECFKQEVGNRLLLVDWSQLHAWLHLSNEESWHRVWTIAFTQILPNS